MRYGKMIAAVSLLAGLVSCGGTLIMPKTSDYSAIEGNWHLVGENSIGGQQTGAFISLAVGVSGSTIYATGDVGFLCPQNGFGWSGNYSGIGQIKPNRSFSISQESSVSGNHLSISGMVPDSGSSDWSGTYHMVDSSITMCSIDEVGTFTASQYPSFSGAYSGTITGDVLVSGASKLSSPFAMTLQVFQQPPSLSISGSQELPQFDFPLAGTVRVSGSPCFVSGTVANGSVAGDQVYLSLSMNDGSTLDLNGRFTDQTETTLYPVWATIRNGTCTKQVGVGTLTLQTS